MNIVSVVIFFLGNHISIAVIMELAMFAIASSQLLSVVKAEYVELCETETFSPQCDHGQVILIDSAWYGRMRLGRCVKSNFGGFLGCKADGLSILDRKCSGRRTCQISIPDPVLDTTRPCQEELKTYLELSYQCVTVDNSGSSCEIPAPMFTTAAYIGRTTLSIESCGSSLQPWRLEGKVGQRIRLTLLDFNPSASPSTGHRKCREYGTVIEGDGKRKVPICGGNTRLSPIVTTRDHSAQLLLYKISDESINYVIKYELIGCADFVVPHPFIGQRVGDEIIVRCPSSSTIWSLSCINDTWTGALGNCSQTNELAEEPMASRNNSFVSLVFSIVVILILAFLTSIGIFVVGYIYHRRKFQARRNRDHIYDQGTAKQRCQACSNDSVMMGTIHPSSSLLHSGIHNYSDNANLPDNSMYDYQRRAPYFPDFVPTQKYVPRSLDDNPYISTTVVANPQSSTTSGNVASASNLQRSLELLPAASDIYASTSGTFEENPYCARKSCLCLTSLPPSSERTLRTFGTRLMTLPAVKIL